jgi:hypothetical protein
MMPLLCLSSEHREFFPVSVIPNWVSHGQKCNKFIVYLGRAIAQAISRSLSTAAARVRARVCSSGIYGE